VKIFFLEIGHIGFQKIKNFMLISKKQICLSDKMPPKKVKIKKRKKMGISKIRKQFFNFNFFWGHFVTKTKLENSFLILTFFGGILSIRQVCFFEFSIKFLIF
jgi:hypothetical protein